MKSVMKVFRVERSASLRDLVVYVVSRFPRGVGRTRLMKILFLVDFESSRKLGAPATGLEWRRYFYGPFSEEVLRVLDELVDEEKLAVDEGPEKRYVALVEPPVLPDALREIVDYVVDEYGFLRLEDLLKVVYEKGGVEGKELGEKIELDPRRVILGLAEQAYEERCLRELLEYVSEYYGDALEAVHPGTLVVYGIVSAYLARRDPEKLRKLTEELLDALDSVKREVSVSPPRALSRETREKALKVYWELREEAARALEGK